MFNYEYYCIEYNLPQSITKYNVMNYCLCETAINKHNNKPEEIINYIYLILISNSAK